MEESLTLTNSLNLKRNFETMMNDQQPRNNITPKEYLMDVCKVAMKQNTIAHIDTVARKTMLTLMIIKEFALSLAKQPSAEKKLIIFLAPTRCLVEKYFYVVNGNIELVVDFYHEGKVTKIDGKKVDKWDAVIWEHEINKNQVMVMTPEILLDVLRNGFMGFERICLLIIDECHYASGNHPYVSIMKEFYLKSVNKPRVFGMTASQLVTKKGVTEDEDCQAQTSALESILDSLVYTTQSSTKLENVTFTTFASLKYSFYEPNKVAHVDLKAQLKSSLQLEFQLLEIQMSLQENSKDTEEKYIVFRKRLANDYSTIVNCIDELGLLCAYEVVKICVASALKAVEECDFLRDCCSKYFLEESLTILENSLPNGHANIFDAGCDFKNIVAADYISPKLYQLFKLIQSFGGATKVSCIIFVETILTAEVLAMILKRVVDFSDTQISYMTSNATSVDAMTTKLQKETPESFHTGKADLLLGTYIEEGIDVPTCSTMILFDIPKTVRSNVQSWGRLRQSCSQFFVMVERGNTKQREQICDIIRTEHAMNIKAKQRDPDTRAVEPCTLQEPESDHVETTGAPVIKKLPANKCEENVDKNLQESDTSGSRITAFNHQPAAAQTSNANEGLMMKASISEANIPAITLKTTKGGPRSTLSEVCKKMQWLLPALTPTEEKSKTLVPISDGVNTRSVLIWFVSHISLTIPDHGVIELTGEARVDKKSSLDSAALLMIYELQKLGKLRINKVES